MLLNLKAAFILVFCNFGSVDVQDKRCTNSPNSTLGINWPDIQSGHCTFSQPPCVDPTDRQQKERCCENGEWSPHPNCIKVNSVDKCDNIYDSNLNVNWQTTANGSCVVSEHACVNSDNIVQIRCCLNGIFYPPPDCVKSVQPPSNQYCSEDFDEEYHVTWFKIPDGTCIHGVPSCTDFLNYEQTRCCDGNYYGVRPICSSNLKNCENETINEHTWPTTEIGGCASSYPTCYNEKNEEICRQCRNGVWDEAPICKRPHCLESETGEYKWPTALVGVCKHSTPPCYNKNGEELCRYCTIDGYEKAPACEKRDCKEEHVYGYTWQHTPSGDCGYSIPMCHTSDEAFCRRCSDGVFEEVPSYCKSCLTTVINGRTWPSAVNGFCAYPFPPCYNSKEETQCRKCNDGIFPDSPVCEVCKKETVDGFTWRTIPSGTCAYATPPCYTEDDETIQKCRSCIDGIFEEIPMCIGKDCQEVTISNYTWPTASSGSCVHSTPPCYASNGTSQCRECRNGSFVNLPVCQKLDCQEVTIGEFRWPTTSSGTCVESIPDCYIGQKSQCRKCKDGTFEEPPPECQQKDCPEEQQGMFFWPTTRHNLMSESIPSCLNQNYIHLYRKCINGRFQDQPDCSTNLICKESFNEEKGVIWPTTYLGECTHSTPLCINYQKELSTRCCSGSWDCEPECIEKQYEINPCPEGLTFDEQNKLCYKIIEETRYPPNCPYKETVSFTSYKHLVENFTVWLPVEKEVSYNKSGVGMMKWVEFSDLYQQPFYDYYKSVDYLKENCMVYNNHYKFSVNCNEYHSAVCAYEILSTRRFNYCNQVLSSNRCSQADYNTTTQCFCVENLNKKQTSKPAELLIPYQNKIFDEILTTSEACLIALEKKYHVYTWINSNEEPSYTYWSKSATFPENQSLYTFLTKDGWLAKNNTLNANCVINQRNILVKAPQIQITFYKEAEEIIIIVENFEDLKNFSRNVSVYCFSNADLDSVIFRYEVQDKFVLKPFKQGPGVYWCEALRYEDSTIIKSNELLVNFDTWIGNEFVAIIKYKVYIQTLQFTEDTFKLIQNIFLEHPSVKNKYHVKVMEPFFRINLEDNSALFNLHFTKIGKRVCAFKDHFKNYKDLSNIILTITQEKRYESFLFLESLSSTEYCFKDGPLWPATESDQIAYPTRLCVRENGSVLTRKCIANFTNGAEWETLNETFYCDETSSATEKLIEILEECKKDITEKFDELNKVVVASLDKLEPIDLYIISKFLEVAAGAENFPPEKLVGLVSHLSKIDQAVLGASQKEYNATNSILGNVDRILVKTNVTKGNPEIKVKSEKFLVAVVDLSMKNLSGVVLKNTPNGFDIILKYGANPVEDGDDFDVVFYLDQKLKEQILVNAENRFVPQIVVAIYIENSLFSEKRKNSHKISIIFDVLLPGFENVFAAPLKLTYKLDEASSPEKLCAFWEFDRNTWREDSKNLTDSSAVSCDFWHVTHFALLLLTETFEDYYGLLDLITTINSILSLFGLSCIILTAVIFEKWRSNSGNQMLVHFSLAIALQISLLYVSSSVHDYIESARVCLVVGGLLHYSIISEFIWMLMVAILQFRRFVNVFGGPPKYVVLKSCFCGWVIPLCPVFCVLFLDPNSYLEGEVGLCYPSGLTLYFSIWIPITLIIFTNIIIFAYIIFNITHKKTDCAMDNDGYFQWRLAFLLFFMLGLTWVFGYFMTMEFGIVFVYLFSFSASLQGFVMFLFFIVLNKNTRTMYVRALKHIFRNELK